MSGKLLLKGQKGALLIGLIVTMVIVSIAGAATYHLTTGSSLTQLFKNSNLQAHYLAESGARYAAPLVQQDLNPGSTTQNIPLLNNKSFTLSPGQFTLTIDNTKPAYALITSLGTLNPGGWLETKRQITYQLPKPFHEPFHSSTFAKNWSIASGGGDVGSVGPAGNEPALRQQAPAGDKVATVALNWDGALGVPNPGMPDLYDQWLSYNKLLSYELQVKAAAEYQGNKGNYYMLGLSFRLNTQGDLNPANDTSYGVSFFRSRDKSNTDAAWLASLDSNFTSIRNGNVYIVFWRRVTPGGPITLLDHAPLFPRWAIKQTFGQGAIILPSVAKSNGRSYICITTAGCQTANSTAQEPSWPTTPNATVTEKGGGSGTWRENGAAGDTGLLTPGGTLADWSTLAVKLEERYCTSPSDTVCSATSGTRANFVTVYTAQADIYPRNTISWDYNTYFKPVTWSWRVGGQLLASPQTVLDGSLTSDLTYGANPVIKPFEIGIHGFYDSRANNDMFFDDFALRLPPSATFLSSGAYQQYY